MKERTVCVNGDGRPIRPPSAVLCKGCLQKLTEKWEKIAKEWPVGDVEERE